MTDLLAPAERLESLRPDVRSRLRKESCDLARVLVTEAAQGSRPQHEDRPITHIWAALCLGVLADAIRDVDCDNVDGMLIHLLDASLGEVEQAGLRHFSPVNPTFCTVPNGAIGVVLHPAEVDVNSNAIYDDRVRIFALGRKDPYRLAKLPLLDLNQIGGAIASTATLPSQNGQDV